MPGQLNLADAATRSQLEAEAIPFDWLVGPAFLYIEPSSWPKDLPCMAEKEEMRSMHLNLADAQVFPVFDWNFVRIVAHELSALIRLEEKYRHWVQLCQKEVSA